MKKKTIILIIAIILVIIITMVFIYWNNSRIKKNECIEECSYEKYSEEYSEGISKILTTSEKMVWRFEGRNFQTRDQCIDYCMVSK